MQTQLNESSTNVNLRQSYESLAPAEDRPLRVVELFSGIGAQAMALRGLGVPFTSVTCEVDRHAIASYQAIHGDTPNLGDITEVTELPGCDLLTYSFPCQSLSISGRQDGMAEGSGTKSSLAWEVIRLLRVAESQGRLPRWLVMENVKGLLSRRNTAEFARLRAELEDMGYTNSWSVLNAMDFGVPQKRERVFMVSSLDGRVFTFPEGARTELRLRDLLEAPEDVDPSLFLSDEKVARYEEHARRHREAGHGLGWRPREGDGVSPTVLTNPTKGETNTIIVSGTLGGYEQTSRVYDPSGVSPTVTTPAGGGHIPAILYPEGTKKGYREAHEGDGLVMPRPTLARGTVQCDCTPTLTTGGGCGTGTVVADGDRLRIRYLSPRECWRLMGQPDWAYDRAVEAGVSRTQLYRQAGNSIVVPVLEAVFGAMLSEDSWRRDPQSRLEVGQ